MNTYYCSNCKGPRKHKILFEVKKSGEEDYSNFRWIEKYRTIECLGCENISFLKVYGDSLMLHEGDDGQPEYYEDEEIFPQFLLNGKELQHTYYLPTTIKDIYIETINAFKIKSLILTAGGFRAVIEATCNHLKIKKGSLEQRIDLLHSKGHLTLNESKRLHSIRFLGNDALHEIGVPKADQLNILLEITNHLLSNLFINDKIIEGKIETIIDSYDDFMKLLQNRIDKKMLNKEVKLMEIIGKSKRLISNHNFEIFKKTLIEDIKRNQISFLEITNEQKLVFKVLAEPELGLFW